MNKKLFVLTLIIPLAILGAISPGEVIPRANAVAGGGVCIAQITDTKCVSPGPIFNGPFTSPNTLLRVPVMINHTNPFNGFDITLNSSDTSKLKPYAIDITGSIMPAGTITLANCVAAILISGASCGSWENSATVRLAQIGPTGFLAPQDTTGLLFTAIFRITGTTVSPGILINFQNKCDPISSSSGTLCVSVSNGSITPVPEFIQTGGFDNSNTALLPYATLATTTTNLGQSLAGAPTHAYPTVTYTATSQNGFNTTATATLNLAASFNGTGIRPTIALNTTFVDLTGTPRRAFTQTGTVPSTVPSGVFLSTITATYQAQDLSTLTTSSLSAAFTLSLNVTDYTIKANPNPAKIQPPGSQPVTVTISPKASFNGAVNLYVTIPVAALSAGIGASLSSSTISGGSGISTLTVTTTSITPVGNFTLTVLSNTTLAGFTKSHSTTLTIQITGFTVVATPPLAQTVGTAETSVVKVSYLNGFTGTIMITNNTVTNLSCLAIGPVPFSANGTLTISCISLIAGSYSLTINAAGGTKSISITIIFTFTLHDVTINSVTISPTGPTPVGTKFTVTVQLQNKGGVDEQVLVILLVDNLTIQPTQNVTVRANTSQTVTLIWDSSQYSAKTYNITVTTQLSHGAINAESSQQILSKSAGSLTLQPAASSPLFDTTTILIIAGLIVAIAAAGTVLVLRSRRKPADGTQSGTL